MAGWFELNKSKDDQFRFVLKSDDNEILLSSELYKVKGSATNGIQSVQSNCSDDARYERKEAANGKFFFNLKAANHQVIGTSLMYSTADAREAAIALTKSGGTTATIKDHT